MELRAQLISGIGILGTIATGLGFVAEAKKRTEVDLTRRATDGQCFYPRSPSMGFGLAASIFALLTQIYSNSLGGCICCNQREDESSPHSTYRRIAIVCLVFSWFSASISFLLLASGAAVNEGRSEPDTLSNGCYALKTGIFAGGSLLSLATIFLGIAYNVLVLEITRDASSLEGSSEEGSDTEEDQTPPPTEPSQDNIPFQQPNQEQLEQDKKI